jgi:hypothetical protein
MRSFRTILAAAIAAWLGILPALGAMAAFSQLAGATTMQEDGGMPCDHPKDSAKAPAGCALKCFQVCADELVSPLMLPPPPGDTERSFVAEAFRSRPTVPPFRPPAI